MNRSFLIIGLFLALSLSAWGQKQKAQPQEEPSGSASTAPQPTSSKSNKPSDASADKGLPIQAGTTVEAVLQSTLDVRKSRVGDEVVLKTTKAVKQNGEILIPKGAHLVGRVTDVKRKTKENAVSQLGMVIDRAQGKNLDIPLNLSIVSVASAQAAAATDLFASDASASGSSRAASGSRGGGGLLSGVGPTLGGAVNTATSSVGSLTGATANTIGHTTGTLGQSLNGLQVTQSLSGSAASTSTLSAAGKDVKVNKGATFRLQVTGSPQDPE